MGIFNASSTERFQSGVRKILLLQGPVGPFFRELNCDLENNGFQVKQVIFNAADHLFLGSKECVRFSGSNSKWEAWLRFELSQNPPDAIVLFGSMRPMHRIARALAKSYGVAVLSLEEGYLRSGFISCEIGGNNQHSPLCNWSPELVLDNSGKHPATIKSNFGIMSFWGALYYLVRDTFSPQSDGSLFHRKRENPFILASSWVGHFVRRLTAHILEAPRLRSLLSDRTRKFILVPLQVPTDSQIKNAARGWSSEALFEAAMQGLVEVSGRQELVFKLHPLDRTGHRLGKTIRRRAKELGISSSVHVIQSGKLGELTEHSSGMIVINSTSAFSALHHRRPVLVMGDAIYRHHEIVTVGTDAKDIESFFESRSVKREEDIQAFLNTVRSKALLPGDFYIAKGRRIAVQMIVQELGRLTKAYSSVMTAAE